MAAIDFILLCNLSLYYLAALAGLVIAITVGVNRINFQGQCILYGEFHWTTKTSFTWTGSGASTCDFPIYFSVVGLIFYGLGMGLYHTYAFKKARKDPTIGPKMLVIPFLLVNGVVALFTLVVACILSVGFASFCSSFMDGGYKKNSCADGQVFPWVNFANGKTFDTGNYVGYMTTAQVAAWSVFVVWLAQVGLGILRFRRNRDYRLARTTST